MKARFVLIAFGDGCVAQDVDFGIVNQFHPALQYFSMLLVLYTVIIGCCCSATTTRRREIFPSSNGAVMINPSTAVRLIADTLFNELPLAG